MSLANYFENVKGTGILATADPEGRVDIALYARPQVIDEDTVAFNMGNHLSYGNLTVNPHAAYLFLEQAQGYNGLRMHLTKAREETDPDRIDAIRRENRGGADFPATDGHLVLFQVDEVRPLVSD